MDRPAGSRKGSGLGSGAQAPAGTSEPKGGGVAGAPAGAPASAQDALAEPPLEARVRSAQRATPEEIVAIGRKIWAEVGRSGVAAADGPGNEALLARLQDEYRDFATSFPLVLRWTVQARQFSAEALRKYLRLHAHAALDTRGGFLELQAEYLVLLYREAHSHPDEALVRKYRAAVVKQLLEEDATFLRLQREAEADLDWQAAAIDRERRQRLYECLRRGPAGPPEDARRG